MVGIFEEKICSYCKNSNCKKQINNEILLVHTILSFRQYSTILLCRYSVKIKKTHQNKPSSIPMRLGA